MLTPDIIQLWAGTSILVLVANMSTTSAVN